MPSIYVYKLTVDDGGAPCVTPSLLSLSICKPAIRRSAREGDLVFGFAANSLHRDNRLIYIAEVTEKVVGGQYYATSRFKARHDCIYRRSGDRLVWKKSALFHEVAENRRKDLGFFPLYKNAITLLSEDFRYFGADGSAAYKLEFPRIGQLVDSLGQGHRVNLGNDLRDQLYAFKQDIWEGHVSKAVGRSANPPNRRACHSDGHHRKAC